MNVNIEVPQDLYDQAKLIADAHHIPVNELFASAFSEQLANWRRLQERAARGSREDFLRVLDRVPDVEPEEYDRL